MDAMPDPSIVLLLHEKTPCQPMIQGRKDVFLIVIIHNDTIIIYFLIREFYGIIRIFAVLNKPIK